MGYESKRSESERAKKQNRRADESLLGKAMRFGFSRLASFESLEFCGEQLAMSKSDMSELGEKCDKSAKAEIN